MNYGQVAAVVEHALPGSENYREEQYAVLVDEIVFGEPADQSPGAEYDEVAVGAVLEVRDGARHVPAG